jgi:hypothetical protein
MNLRESYSAPRKEILVSYFNKSYITISHNINALFHVLANSFVCILFSVSELALRVLPAVTRLTVYCWLYISRQRRLPYGACFPKYSSISTELALRVHAPAVGRMRFAHRNARSVWVCCRFACGSFLQGASEMPSRGRFDFQVHANLPSGTHRYLASRLLHDKPIAKSNALSWYLQSGL